jgi:hypothetical protein
MGIYKHGITPSSRKAEARLASAVTIPDDLMAKARALVADCEADLTKAARVLKPYVLTRGMMVDLFLDNWDGRLGQTYNPDDYAMASAMALIISNERTATNG